MIELTSEQRLAMSKQTEIPVRAINPDTRITYVLIPESTYVELQARLTEEDANQLLRDMHPTVMQLFGREGWDDPEMDVYNDLDPRQPS